MDDRLSKHESWQKAKAKAKPGRDPLGLTSTQAQVEYFTTERYAAPKHYNNPPPTGRSAFGLIIMGLGSLSRGYLKIRSRNPRDKPNIQHNYLSNPLDVLVLAEACKLGSQTILEGKGTKDLILGSWPTEDKHHQFTELSQWEDYVRKNATTCFHPSSTCKMGTTSDPGAVVDARLRVRGVQGLRVADCSIMPKLNNGHPQAVAYAIGEKCADMIKDDWKDLRRKDTFIATSLL